MDGHGGPSVFDMCRIEQGGDLRCAEHRQISLRGWLLVVLADGIVRVTAGRAGITPAAESTHVFMFVSLAVADVSACAFCAAATTAFTESVTLGFGGMNVVNCADAMLGAIASNASTS